MTICLNMIVKNESRVIRRCLDSVRPFIDHWVIVDTGSSDGTQDVIREALKDVPGELHERPWKDFGHNRSEALELARGKADYTLIIDADEVLVPAPGFVMPTLDADEYMTVHEVEESGHGFYLSQLVRSALPWRYVGVLHEVIQCDVPRTTAKLEGLVCKGFFDSARNVDPKSKYEADAAVLEAALKGDPDNARYVFYLAQSYRDSKNLDRAIETYQRRVAMQGWDEEVWYSLFQIAVLSERRGGPFAPTLEAYLNAHQFRPSRAEPLCELARHYRGKGQYALAHLFASRAAATPRPADILFLDHTVYDWRALDELCIASYYVGLHRDTLVLADQLLSSGTLPASERARVEANRKFAVDALGASASRTADDVRRRRNTRKADKKRTRR
ncbi:MAG: glycosyltransferase family 2 protein [Polyangiaceae bacterium]